MKNINAIFDVGSNNGLDGINYAVFNPKCTIYAFEPNPFFPPHVFFFSLS